jgi:hypothetical protein
MGGSGRPPCPPWEARGTPAKPRRPSGLLGHAPSLVGGVLLIVLQLGGGTPLQRSIDQIQRSVTRPVPQAPSPSTSRPGDVWVPDRVVTDPTDGRLVHLPGHWQRRLPSGELQGPPFTICDSSGVCTTTPAGPRPLQEQRQSP